MHTRFSRQCSRQGIPLWGIFSLLVLVVMLCACGGSTTSSASSTQSQGPVTIGVSLSLTGDQAEDGQATEKGYQLWADYVNANGGLLGHQIKLVVLDDSSKIDQTATNYEKLITTDKVNFVVGPFNDPQTVAGARVAGRHGYAFINPTGTAPSDFQYGLTNLFTVSLSATRYLGSFERYVTSLPTGERPKTVAYASSNNPFTQPQIDSVRPLLEQGGLTTSFYTIFPGSTTNYTLIAQKIVASGADVVVLGTEGVADCAAFIKTFASQHFNPKLIIATAGPDQGAAFVSAVGSKNVEGLLVPNGGWWPTIHTFGNQQFVQEFLTKYGGTADDISSDTVQAYSVGQVLQQAVTQAQSLDNAKLMEHLRQGAFQSLQGPVKFSADGQNPAATAFLFQWRSGQLIPVFPANQAQAALEYPKPSWS
jgi:branched-chain amino acid transport system substrate-binding protein